MRTIISGGGTGGHIFPAISIANAIKELDNEAEILFVGAKGRMEMERVPAAGYKIEGIPAKGLKRPLYNPANLLIAIDYIKCLFMAGKILKRFKPDVVVGVGGYASAAIVAAAAKRGIPVLLQEQNSFAGLVNRKNGKSAGKICVAYEGMERFFPKEKILLTGNPVRQGLLQHAENHDEALSAFGLQPGRKTVLLIGGSLGARTLNESMLENLKTIASSGVQFIWQTGGYYYAGIRETLKLEGQPANLFVTDFIAKMEEAYAAADLVISRAGASSISELCLLGKPAVLVPSPNVAEDHQTKNALALVEKDAALYVKDAEAVEKLIPLALQAVEDENRLAALSQNIRKLAFADAADRIAEEVCRLAGTYRERKK